MKSSPSLLIIFSLLTVASCMDSEATQRLYRSSKDNEPTFCDHLEHHLCCYDHHGNIFSNEMTALNCLPYKEIAKTNEGNIIGLTGGRCNHEHLCCKRIFENKKFNTGGFRPKSVTRAEECRIVWSYDPKIRNALGFKDKDEIKAGERKEEEEEMKKRKDEERQRHERH